MTIHFDTVGDATTAKNYLDFARPKVMDNADSIFNKLALRHGGKPMEVITFMSDVTEQLMSVNYDSIDDFWGKMEKKLYGDNTLSVNASTDVGKYSTGVSLFYNALNVVDSSSETTYDLSSLKDLYYGVRDYISRRILGHQEGTDKRVLQRVLNTIDARFDKVSKRFNKLVDDGQMHGPRLQTY